MLCLTSKMRGLSLLCVLLLAASAASRYISRFPVPGGLPDEIDEAVNKWKKSSESSIMRFPGKHGKTVSTSLTTKWAITYSDSDVIFHLFTKSNESDTEGTVVTMDKDSLLSAGWNTSNPTRVVIHGFWNDITSPAIQDNKNAYLATGNYNVIGVDWSALCPVLLYVSAVVNMKPTGQRVGEFIEFLVENDLAELSQIHIVGHSLGAHVAGIAGNTVSSGKVARVTGLDPALPLVKWLSSSYRISEDDAEIVDIIHTSAGSLGYADPLGHVDFYPNGGKNQPGCGSDSFYVCSHDRSITLFAESISDGVGYYSLYCNSEAEAESGACASSFTAVMGDELQYSTEGLYYLATNYSSPYNLAV